MSTTTVTEHLSTLRTRIEDRARLRVRWAVRHGIPRHLTRLSARRGDLQSRILVTAGEPTPDSMLRLMDEIRAQGPITGTGVSAVTVDHAAAKEILASNDFRTGVSVPGQEHRLMADLMRWSARDGLHPTEPPSLLVIEPPDHTRYRKLVTKAFTARAVRKLQSRTEEIAQGLLDDMDGRDAVDLVNDYCRLLPVTVICEILGVPASDRGLVLHLGSKVAASIDSGIRWRDFQDAEAGLDALDDYLGEHFVYLREHPGDNLFSELVTAKEGGVGLTDRELRATAGLVLAAGFETTVNLLSNGIQLLCDNPDQLHLARSQPQLWATCTDEALRLDPPVLLTSRTCTRDTQVCGIPVSAGTMVLVVLAGANRDPKVFADPDRFRADRDNARDHLSFSAGRHFCLGAQLARMEGEVGLRMLLERYDIDLLPGSNRRANRMLRGMEHLPARLVSRTSVPA